MPRRVVDLERARVERLAHELVPHLRGELGQLVVRVTEVEDVDRWRRAARRAGRLVGGKVATGVSRDGSTLWAVRTDGEVTPAQQAEAARVMQAILDPPGGPPGGRGRRP